MDKENFEKNTKKLVAMVAELAFIERQGVVKAIFGLDEEINRLKEELDNAKLAHTLAVLARDLVVAELQKRA